MKKLTFTIILILSQILLFAQCDESCLPEGIIFTTQEEIDDFQINYPNCTEIEGDVSINGDNITSLNGLSVLTSIKGYLNIHENPLLENLSGLDNLTSIGDWILGHLLIMDNIALTNLSGLESLEFIGGSLRILSSSNITSLLGLESLITVGGDLTIEANISMINLNGLESLKSIGGDLRIGIAFNGWGAPNPILADISALESLTSIGQSLRIGLNDSLTNLVGLNNLTSIGHWLEIIANNSLTNLSGLDNIDAGSIGILTIQGNELLSTCDVQSICDYLATPNGTIEIHSNAPGCNSQQEVEEACDSITLVENISAEHELAISPNPIKENAILSLNLSSPGSIDICIYNTTGICIKTWRYCNVQPGQKDFVLNMSKFRAGIYFCRVKVGNEMITKKIIRINE
ncbi:MAG: T9SS type A sorting domain-containing protein [Mariniphaga sp.]|nr:T9SS type A sorting domain-containing protein [Mariniphaga sp.]